jgi:hypothetical protein
MIIRPSERSLGGSSIGFDDGQEVDHQVTVIGNGPEAGDGVDPEPVFFAYAEGGEPDIFTNPRVPATPRTPPKIGEWIDIRSGSEGGGGGGLLGGAIVLGVAGTIAAINFLRGRGGSGGSAPAAAPQAPPPPPAGKPIAATEANLQNAARGTPIDAAARSIRR